MDFEDLSSFDALLADQFQRNPSEYLPLVREGREKEQGKQKGRVEWKKESNREGREGEREKESE